MSSDSTSRLRPALGSTLNVGRHGDLDRKVEPTSGRRYTPPAARRRLITRLREAVLAGRMSLKQADAALVRR